MLEELMKKLINLLTLQRDALVPVKQPIKPVAAPKFRFDTYDNSLRSVRMICDEMGLNWEEKAIICACIYQESRFSNKAKGENKKNGVVTSTDWGIVQVNDYWNIGRGKYWASVKQVTDNPERAVRWMITNYKQGRLNLWSSYKFGHYKQWLKLFM